MKHRIYGIIFLVLVFTAIVAGIYLLKYGGSKNTQLPIKSDKQNIRWHDPYNKILGFRFDAPNTWVVDHNPYASERQITVASCAINSCDRMSFDVQVVSGEYVPESNIPSEWTATKVDISGIVADKIVKLSENAIITDINFMRGGDWYHIELYSSKINNELASPIFDYMLKSLAFVDAQKPQTPSEYQLFKDIIDWTLSFQDRNTDWLRCFDGRKGNVSNQNIFSMVSAGFGEPPGDVDSLHEKLIGILQSNGWQICKPVGEMELADTQSATEVFIKNNRLLGIKRHYSMGVGNSLQISMQYIQPSASYTNERYGFQFDYPTSYLFKEDDVSNDFWVPPSMNFISEGERVATVEILESTYPETNFEGAYFSVSINKNLSEQDCKKYLDNYGNPVELPVSEIINGITYYKGNNSGAIHGHFAKNEFLHAYRNSACYELGLGVRIDLNLLSEIYEEDIFFDLENIMYSTKIN